MAVIILSVYQYKHGAHDKWIIILYAFKFDFIILKITLYCKWNNVHRTSFLLSTLLVKYKMRVCCLRVFVDGELWDCLLIVKSNREYVLYTTVDQLPFSVSAELCSLGLNGARDPMPTVMDANCLECVIKALANSNTLKRSVVRRMNSVSSVDNNNIVVGFNDVRLVTPDKYRLPYTW